MQSTNAKVAYLLLAILFMPAFAYGTTIRYNLQTSPDSPQVIQASVDTSGLGKFSLEQPRGLPFSNSVHAPVVQCKTESGIHIAEYGKIIKCREITWSIHFTQLDTMGIDVSEQRNLYSPNGWWVLFEWNDIPRLKEYPNVEVCATVLKTKSADKCRALPALDAAPLIMSWGRASKFKIAANLRFSIYVDNMQQILHDKNWSSLMSQYNYLQQLFATKGAQKQDIDIIWVGIDADAGAMGGASGSQAFISNYIVNNQQVTQESLSQLHWISGHEIFHMLTTFTYPIWITESLAHYYGYKSLVVAKIAHKTPIEIWQSNRTKTPHADTGLYAASDLVENQQDMSYYGLFYSKGAAFWQELDTALMKKGTSLDVYIALLAEGSKSSAQLNKNFVKAMEKILGQRKFSQLIAKWCLTEKE